MSPKDGKTTLSLFLEEDERADLATTCFWISQIHLIVFVLSHEAKTVYRFNCFSSVFI